MEELKIPSSDLQTYAIWMARALAMMHWQGKTDANDIEFVLAPSSTQTQNRSNEEAGVMSNILGRHTMWILDFDCCKLIEMSEGGVDQAITAFLRNDPFYPRPDGSQGLWARFKCEYLKVAEMFTEELATVKLPKLFILGVERHFDLIKHAEEV
jgi:hypothetical protein